MRRACPRLKSYSRLKYWQLNLTLYKNLIKEWYNCRYLHSVIWEGDSQVLDFKLNAMTCWCPKHEGQKKQPCVENVNKTLIHSFILIYFKLNSCQTIMIDSTLNLQHCGKIHIYLMIEHCIEYERRIGPH